MKMHHRIRQIRVSKKITQQEMADYLQINQNTYHLIETGSSSLKVNHFIKICEILDVDFTEFLSIKKDRAISSNKNSYSDSKEDDLARVIDFMKEQLKMKDSQLHVKDEMLVNLIRLLSDKKQ